MNVMGSWWAKFHTPTYRGRHRANNRPAQHEAHDALRGPTLSQFLPDDEEAPRLHYGPGVDGYGKLDTAALDRDADDLVRIVTFVDTDDQIFAVVTR